MTGHYNARYRIRHGAWGVRHEVALVLCRRLGHKLHDEYFWNPSQYSGDDQAIPVRHCSRCKVLVVNGRPVGYQDFERRTA